MKNLNEITNKDFFFCYTKELSDYLKVNEIPYLLKANSVKDGNTFTLYAKAEKLQRLLKEFKEN